MDSVDISVDQDRLPPLRLAAPTNLWQTETLTTLSAIARLVASGDAVTKSALVAATGLARSTASSHVETLVRKGVLSRRGIVSSGTRGRPADRLEISPRAGLVLALDFGARHVNLGVGEINQSILSQSAHRIDVRDGPVAVLDSVSRMFEEQLAVVGDGRTVRTIVVGVPARVYGPSGVAVRPNIMPGWDAFPISATLQRRFGAPVLLENDVNLRAIGEAAALDVEQRPILTIKLGTGVGAGLVDTEGNVFRGYDGAAGDIGHIPVRGAGDLECTCGNRGCIEAAASVPAIIRRIRQLDPGLIREDEDELNQLLDLLRQYDRTAIAVVRSAAEILGEAVAILCNTLNPRRIVISGELTSVTDELLAGVRAVAYQRARPLATRNLVIGHSALGDAAGLAGALVLARQEALSPAGLRQFHL